MFNYNLKNDGGRYAILCWVEGQKESMLEPEKEAGTSMKKEKKRRRRRMMNETN